MTVPAVVHLRHQPDGAGVVLPVLAGHDVLQLRWPCAQRAALAEGDADAGRHELLEQGLAAAAHRVVEPFGDVGPLSLREGSGQQLYMSYAYVYIYEL